MATHPLFSESNFRTETNDAATQHLTQHEAFKQFCHAVAQLTPAEFAVISELVETLHQLANPRPSPQPDTIHHSTIRPTPIISIGPSGIGGRYQKEF